MKSYIFPILFCSIFLIISCDDPPVTSETDLCSNVRCLTGFECYEGYCHPIHHNTDITGTSDTPEETTSEDTLSADDTSTEEETTVTEVIEEVTEDIGCTQCAILEADPPSISFSFYGADEIIDKDILLKNLGPGPLTITSVEFLGNPPAFEVMTDPSGTELFEGNSTSLQIRYTSTGTVTSVQLRVTTNQDFALTIPVNTVSKVPPEACILVQPPNLNFGGVQRGHDLTLPLDIESCGTSDLTFSGIERGSFLGMPLPDTFQWVITPNTPVILAPGEHATVDVTFTPGRAGLQSGHINVVSNDMDTQRTRVELFATAEQPPMVDQDVHIQIDWDEDMCDVDLHFVLSSNNLFDCTDDCYYANSNPDWGAMGDWQDDPFLDVDDVDGYGPENINVQDLLPGTYRIALHYYSDSHDESPSVSTNASVRVYLGGQLAGEYGPQFLDSTGRIWDVATLEWPAATLTTVNTLSTTNYGGCL